MYNSKWLNKLLFNHLMPTIKRKTTLNAQIEKTTKTLLITLSLMIFVLGIAFFKVTGDNAQKGYKLIQEQLKNEDLRSKNENLKAKLTQATAFSKIETDSQLQHMSALDEQDSRTYLTQEDNDLE